MDRGLAVLLTACVGAGVGLQAPINSMLGKSIGTYHAAVVSFLVGTVVLVAISTQTAGSFSEVRSVPWHYLLGGLLGAAYVSTVLVTVRTLGAGGLTVATIAGQLTITVMIDHFGWLGVERDPISLDKVLGVALLAGGVYFVVRD